MLFKQFSRVTGSKEPPGGKGMASRPGIHRRAKGNGQLGWPLEKPLPGKPRQSER